ncbi:hypothetical protein MPS_5294 [Mycobacterium pseudoshottsii JCM 15466]|nr:hypothetical protein MPS_5294 [Mycobacterium pseudoshottsii JCM 15466]
MRQRIHNGVALVVGWLLHGAKLRKEIGVTACQLIHDKNAVLGWNDIENVVHGFLHPLRLFAQAVVTCPFSFRLTVASLPIYRQVPPY